MKNLVPFILMCFSTWICGQFVEIVWAYLILIFIISWVYARKEILAFVVGFFSVAFVWSAQMILKEVPNHGVLSGYVSQIFPMKSQLLIYVLTVLVGALPAGLMAYSAKLLRGKA